MCAARFATKVARHFAFVRERGQNTFCIQPLVSSANTSADASGDSYLPVFKALICKA